MAKHVNKQNIFYLVCNLFIVHLLYNNILIIHLFPILHICSVYPYIYRLVPLSCIIRYFMFHKFLLKCQRKSVIRYDGVILLNQIYQAYT